MFKILWFLIIVAVFHNFLVAVSIYLIRLHFLKSFFLLRYAKNEITVDHRRRQGGGMVPGFSHMLLM